MGPVFYSILFVIKDRDGHPRMSGNLRLRINKAQFLGRRGQMGILDSMNFSTYAMYAPVSESLMD